MSKVKLLICYHKPATLFKDEILTPIHVGRSLAKKKMPKDDKSLNWLLKNMIGDDTGENISAENGCYNEMTSLYWAWKNYDELGDPDYIGLMHYRRHFVFRENEYDVYNVDDFDADTYLDLLNYSPENVEKLVEGCDFLPHIGKVMNVYNHYLENHRKEDLDLAVDIMLEKYPEYEQITKKYFAGDDSNFCNMFIFNKKIFFEYCKWIFDILGEFANRVDVSEKRFFISERLTGIFVAKLMNDKNLKHKVLPIAFIEDPVKIPIAIPLNKNNTFQVANTITSILNTAKGQNEFEFYLLHDDDIDDLEKENFIYFKENFSYCQIKFIQLNYEVEYYPLVLSRFLKKINKCIYLSGDIIVLHDLGEFYRVCSVDDYYAVGLPMTKYDIKDTDKRVSPEILVLNCAQMRKHEIFEKALGKMKQTGIIKAGIEIFNELCAKQLGYTPWYFITRESDMPYKDYVIRNPYPRAEIQLQATWRAFVVYDDKKPWLNNQGVYSIFWWDHARKVPDTFTFVGISTVELEQLYIEQQKEINRPWERVKKKALNRQALMPTIMHDQDIVTPNSPMKDKIRNYYQMFGLKKTVIHMFGSTFKAFGRKEG